MKKGVSKFISVFLVVLMLIGSAPLSGFIETDWSEFKINLPSIFSTETRAANSQADTRIIEFGVYPQSQETDPKIVSALNSASCEWVSYGYYSGTGSADDGNMFAHDYMKYTDVILDDQKYRGIYFETYRPRCTGYASSTDGSNSFQDDNGYIIGNTYWFRFEPIKWRVLDENSGLVMCNNIIDSQAFDNYVYMSSGMYKYTDKNKKYLASDYGRSTIRKWLNDTFYEVAFSDNEKSKIKSKKVTGVFSNDDSSVFDRVFLMSHSMVNDTKYGFNSSSIVVDKKLQLKGSDYAKSQGLEVAKYYENGSYWWLSNACMPTSWYWQMVCYVNEAGITYAYACSTESYRTNIGICPAMYLNLSQYNFEDQCNSILITPRNIQSFASYSTGDDNLGFIKHEGEANWKLGNVSLKIGNKEYSQSENKTFVIPLAEITDDIVLSRSSYYDYIIPKEVAQSFYSSKEEYELNAWMSKDEHLGNKPYVSSVFAKVDGADTNFVDIRHEKVTVNEGEYCRFYISAGNVKGNTTYVISQDNSHKISKSTRSFSDNLASLSSTKSTVVYVKDKNGTSKAVSVKLSKEKANAFEKIYDVCKDGKFSLGGSDGLKLTLPKSWPLVGGASLNLLDFKIPAGFEISADGTVRMSLGFDWTKKETESKYVVRDKKTGNEYYRTYSDGPKTSTNCDWENLKKDIKEVVSLSKINENKQKSKEAFEKTKKDVLKKSGIKSLEEARKETKGFDIGVSALGFAEGKFVNGEIVFTDVQLSIGGDIKISVTHQNTLWYVALEGGDKVKIAAEWIREVADNDLPLQFIVTLSSEPNAKASGGIGVKGVISAGIYGKASIPVSYEFVNGHFMISLKGEIGAEAEVLFFKTGEISILSGTLGPFETYLWGKKSYMAMPKKIASAYNLNPFSDKNTDITGVTDRDNSKWVGSVAPKKLKASAASAQKTVEVKKLQTDIYKESGVKTVTCGDTTMAVWTSDDGTRDAYNRLKLVYSLFDKETNLWSEPKAVYDDGYNDAIPEIATDGESIYVVWQKFMKKFTAENSKDVESVLGSGEIFLSKYDFENDEFTETARITNNGYYDYSPVVTVENGEPVVFYADSVNNCISETSGNNLNKYASNVSTSVASDLSTVINIDCSTVNGKAEVAYSVDTDGNSETTDDISVFCGSDTFTEFDSEINTLTNIAYAPLDGENVLFVSDGMNIYYKKNGETVSVLENSVPVSEQIAAVCTSNGTSLFWASSTDAGNEIYSCSYSDGKWSDAVQLTSRNNMFTDLSFENVDGNIIGLANESVREYSEEAEAYKTVSTNLVMLRPQNFSDLAIDLAEIKTNNVEIGKEAAIYVTVSNNGNVPCEKLTFEITDNQGISNEYETEAHLLSGKSDVFILPYELTENLNKSEITVRVYDENYSDIASSDNTSVISDIKANMIPDDSKIEEFDDAYILSAVLKNESIIDAENVCVKAVLNDENNEPLTSVSFSNISSDSPQSVELVAPKDKLDYDENGNCIVYFVVSSDNNETITQSFVVSQNTTECEHRNTEIVENVEPTCTEAGESGKLVCSDCGYVFEESVALESNGGHSFTNYVSDGNATCTADGTKTALCDNGCGETDTIADEGSKLGHSYGEWIVDKEATCTENGSKHKECVRGDNTVTETIYTTGNHTDSDHDGKCDTCEADLTEHCSCGCHKTGISGFFFKIKLFFWKLFRSEKNRYCECGKAHW